MAAAEENAEVYYLASDETKTCKFLDNGLYKDEYLKVRSGFYEQLDDGYQLSYYAAGDTEEQEVKLSTAQDATYGEVLMNGDKIWSYKDEAAAKKAAEDNPYTGKWEAVEINYSGIVQKPDEVGLNFELVISPDGSLAAATNGEPDGEGTWEETEDGIAITDGTGSEMSGKLDGERLVVNFGNDFIVTMEKAE